MDHHQQTQQTEKIIVEMLEFLESSSEEENDLEQMGTENSHENIKISKNGFKDNILTECTTNSIKTRGDLKTDEKPLSAIAKELNKLKQQLQSNINETGFNVKKEPNAFQSFYDSLNCKTNLNRLITSTDEADTNSSGSLDFANLDLQYKLENHCRRNYSNSYIQEVHKAIYQDTTDHPPSGSSDYYQAAQNYVLYGKHFLDFPENIQALLNDKNSQNSVAENSNLMKNVGNCLYSKPNIATPNNLASPTGGLTTATSTAAYYQICNSVQAHTRPVLSTNPGNPASYGIFVGNKVTYVAGNPPTTPSLIYNQHSTTKNFISNSLANAALATSPTILYTNPMLTTTTQQYLTQFISTAALMANSIQSSTVATNASGAGIYERLVYAQMLQQHLYQTQQAAAVAAMLQHKQRVAVAAAAAAARHSSNAMTLSSNRSSPQHLTAAQTTSNTNGLNLNTCNRQARSSSPSDLVGIKPQSPIAVAATETSKSSKLTSD